MPLSHRQWRRNTIPAVNAIWSPAIKADRALTFDRESDEEVPPPLPDESGEPPPDAKPQSAPDPGKPAAAPAPGKPAAEPPKAAPAQ